MFSRFVRALFGREKRRAHPDWLEGEAQHAALARLAYAMQEKGEGTTFERTEAMAHLPEMATVRGEAVKTPPGVVLRLGFAASLLDGPPEETEVRFYHHLIQEYFAACELVRRFCAGEHLAGLWKAPWRVREMPDAERGEWDPLPPPPTTGWEETTILAAGLAGEDAARLVRRVQEVNLTLAGRGLAEAGVAFEEEGSRSVKDDLLAGLDDEGVHLRARIAAGHVLGRLGDLRFEARVIDGVRVIEPPLVHVPAGEFLMGSSPRDREAYDDERPQFRVRLDGFWMGQYPVTNAEYACFVEAGGYQEERYWTEAGQAWLRGEDPAGGAIGSIMETRQALIEQPEILDRWEREQIARPQEIETWRRLMAMSEEEAVEALRPIYQERSREQPAFWGDEAYNAPNQPVVGVTWYEAAAYCCWLSGLTGQPCRLPTEAEWEKAARGADGRLWPWGNRWDEARCNSLEGRVLRPTPVGVYPQGVSPYGCLDLAGNVWEWTSSLYRDYPYQADDGREDMGAGSARVLRGGSWSNNGRSARCASRYVNVPGYFLIDIGFRVCALAAF